MVADKVDEHRWQNEILGKRLIEAEKKELEGILPTLYGYHLLFVGDPGLASLAEASLISHKVLIHPDLSLINAPFSFLIGDPATIPMRTESVDVVMLSHILEQVMNPHEILREAHRILIPEGHVIITGFNPISLWGIWHRYEQLIGKMPKKGRMLTISRVRDWLTLLNFQIVGGRMFCFRPPIKQLGIHQKMQFLEKWGGNWPFLGGAYTLVAVKRIVPLTPLRVRWRPIRRLWQDASSGLPKPTTTAKEYHVKK